MLNISSKSSQFHPQNAIGIKKFQQTVKTVKRTVKTVKTDQGTVQQLIKMFTTLNKE